MDRLGVINAELERLHDQINEATDLVEISRAQTQIGTLVAMLLSGEESRAEDEVPENTLHSRLGCLYSRVMELVDSYVENENVPLTDLYENVPSHLVEVKVGSFNLIVVPEEHQKAFSAWILEG